MDNSLSSQQAALYVRVSTQEQATEGYSILAQLERLRAYCKARGWQVAHEYIDPGFSGARLDRPAVTQLIADIEQAARPIGLVLVFKLDRLSRSQKDTLYLIEDVFLRHGVNFISINESFDTTTPYGVAMIGILSAFAQLERENIRLRTQMGLEARAQEGYWRGGGHVPIGYLYDRQSGTIQPSVCEAEQIREIFRRFVDERQSLSRIACEMARKYPARAGTYGSSSEIAHILSRKTYIGLVPWKGQHYQGRHTAIISAELFERAQALLTQRAAPRPRSGALLSGMLWCGRCGARYYAMGAYRGSRKLPCAARTLVHTYTCYSRAKTSPKMIRDPACRNLKWPAAQLDAQIWAAVCALHFPLAAASAAPSAEDMARAIRRQQRKIDRQIAYLLELAAAQDMPQQAIRERLAALHRERQTLEASRQTPPVPASPDARQALALAGPEEKRQIIQSLIERIELDGEQATVFWRFAAPSHDAP